MQHLYAYYTHMHSDTNVFLKDENYKEGERMCETYKVPSQIIQINHRYVTLNCPADMLQW